MADRRAVYANYAISIREKQSNTIRGGMDKNFQNTVKKITELTQLVPYWETYLTDKQAQAVSLYLSNRDLEACDKEFKLEKGGTYTRIFGDKHNDHIGAIGRLQKVYLKLTEAGYYDKNKNLNQE